MDNRAVYTRESKPRITQSAAYVSSELSHLYDNSLHKKLVHGLRKPRMSISCRLCEQFAAYISRGLCNPRLIFPHINRPNVRYVLVFSSQCTALHKVADSKKCHFVKSKPDCHQSDGFLQYLQFPYCTIPHATALAFIIMVGTVMAEQLDNSPTNGQKLCKTLPLMQNF